MNTKTIEQKTQELLPCPFCGSRATEIPQAGDYRVQCSSTTCFLGCSQLQLLPSQWNTRHFASEPVEKALDLSPMIKIGQEKQGIKLGDACMNCGKEVGNSVLTYCYECWDKSPLAQHPSPDNRLEEIVKRWNKDLGFWAPNNQWIKIDGSSRIKHALLELQEYSNQATAKLREELNLVAAARDLTQASLREVVKERDSLLANIKAKDEALLAVVEWSNALKEYWNNTNGFWRVKELAKRAEVLVEQALKPNCGRKDEVE